MFWLKSLDTHPTGIPATEKIAKAMATMRVVLNNRSQGNSGDKTLRVDKEEIILTRHNGGSNKDQKYLLHKDSYKRDKNNEIHDTELRKLSMIIFLNRYIVVAYGPFRYRIDIERVGEAIVTVVVAEGRDAHS